MPAQAALPSAALLRLRSAMRPHHDQIERDVDLMRPDLSLDDYRRFLERSYGFIAACERAIPLQHAPADLKAAARMKSAWLRADLTAVGLSETAIERLPVAKVLPTMSCWPDALGYFYVIEGSTLGGQVLSRHLHATLDVANAISFLQSYGREVGVMWKEMLAVLTAALAEPHAETAIARTARETFQLLGDWHAGRDSTTRLRE